MKVKHDQKPMSWREASPAYCQDGGIGDIGATSSSAAASSAGPDGSPFFKGDRRSHVAAPEDPPSLKPRRAGGRTPLSSRIPPAPQHGVASDGDVDILLLKSSLASTPWERMQANDDALNYAESLRTAMLKRHAKSE
jgi:hypothetical protein